MSRAAPVPSIVSKCDLVRKTRKLWFDYRKPHLFIASRDEIADEIERLEISTPRPCACAAPSLRRELAQMRARFAQAEIMLASVRPRPRRKRACDQRQMLLPLDA